MEDDASSLEVLGDIASCVGWDMKRIGGVRKNTTIVLNLGVMWASNHGRYDRGLYLNEKVDTEDGGMIL